MNDSNCLIRFNVLICSYELHYNSTHRNACSQCKRNFPTSHLLDIHLLEWHDSMFDLLASKSPMVRTLEKDDRSRKHAGISMKKLYSFCISLWNNFNLLLWLPNILQMQHFYKHRLEHSLYISYWKWVIILIKSRESPLEGIKISLSFSRHSWTTGIWNLNNNKASVLEMSHFHNLIQNAWILEFWTHSKKESTVFYVHVLIAKLYWLVFPNKNKYDILVMIVSVPMSAGTVWREILEFKRQEKPHDQVP